VCSSDLAGMAFALYASDHDDRLPASQYTTNIAGFSTNLPWWGVGESPRSHSANLFELVRNGYASLGALSCPGNEHAPVEITSDHQRDWGSLEEVSYSYQLFRGKPARLNSSRNSVILADKSPIIPRARLGESFNPEARSLNHMGRGQNILMSDLRVVFTVRPMKPGTNDNIWLPRSFEIGHAVPFTGTETPADEIDAFVGP